jgi:hypothetical protein
MVTDSKVALIGAGLVMSTEPVTLKGWPPSADPDGGLRTYCTVYVTSAVVGSSVSCKACS